MRLLILSVIFLGLVSCGNNEEGAENPTQKDTSELASDTSVVSDDERLKELNDLIVEDPKNANHYHERAYYYFHKGDVESALFDVKKAIELDSDVAAYYFTKGLFFHSQLRLAEARTAFEQCLVLDEEYQDAYLYMAKIYLALARPTDKDKMNYKNALDNLNKLIEIDPLSAPAYFWRGVAFEELGDSGVAVSNFKTAIETDPNYYDAFVRLGLLYAAAGNDKAESSYKSALSIKPNSTEALFALARYYQDVKRFDEAEAHYKKVVEVDSMYSLAYLNLGYMYMTYDTAYDKAIEYLHRAVYFNPGVYLPMTYYNIGLAFELKGNFKKARCYYENAVEQDNNYLPAAQALDALDRRGV